VRVRERKTASKQAQMGPAAPYFERQGIEDPPGHMSRVQPSSSRI
jgi:hypothetical protein